MLKLTSVQSKSRSNQCCYFADRPWDLNLDPNLFLFFAMNFKYFQRSLTTCAYNPCSIAILFMVFYTLKWHKLSFIWIIITLLHKIIWEYFRLFEISFFYNLIYCPPLYWIWFHYYFICVNLININFHCLFIWLCFLYFWRWLIFFNRGSKYALNMLIIFSFLSLYSLWI